MVPRGLAALLLAARQCVAQVVAARTAPRTASTVAAHASADIGEMAADHISW